MIGTMYIVHINIICYDVGTYVHIKVNVNVSVNRIIMTVVTIIFVTIGNPQTYPPIPFYTTN